MCCEQLITLCIEGHWRHFTDDTFKCIFLNENVRILIKFSLKYVRKGPIDNNPVLVQIMAWRHYLNQWWLVYQRIYASLGLNELNFTFHAPGLIVTVTGPSVDFLKISRRSTVYLRPSPSYWQNAGKSAFFRKRQNTVTSRLGMSTFHHSQIENNIFKRLAKFRAKI